MPTEQDQKEREHEETLRRQNEDHILGLYVNHYNSLRWPREAHRLNCTAMFSIFVNHSGVSSAIRSFYREGKLPDSEKRFKMWRECLAIKRHPLPVQQEMLDTIHEKIWEDERNPVNNPHHPFLFRKEPPANMVEVSMKVDESGEFVWNIEDHVQGVQWDEDELEKGLWELAEERRVIRRMQEEAPIDDQDSMIQQINNARTVD